MTTVQTPSSSGPQPTDMQKKRYEVSLATRNFEIELFWKRALFFWGFIAAAFVAFATFSGEKAHNSALSVVVALFGLVCSFCWTLANRGSKYWQENWETQVDDGEDAITGPLFKLPAPVQDKGWFGAKQFSVSKLAISLSDYLTIIWGVLVARSVTELPIVRSFFRIECWIPFVTEDVGLLILLVFSMLWMILTFFQAKTTSRKT